MERIQRHAEILDDPAERPVATRDRDDDYLVALALTTNVDAIASGDRDLLEADLANPPVWTPRRLAEHIRT